MKNLRLFVCAAALLFAATVNAQEDTMMASTDSMPVMMDAEVEMVAGVPKDEYYAMADAEFAANQVTAQNEERYIRNYEDDIVTGRIWLIVILVVGGLVSGGAALAGHKNMLATMKPEIQHIWPSHTSGETKLNVMIPEHMFSAQLIIRDAEKNVAFETNVDNAATQVELDLADLAPGKYKIRLEGEGDAFNSNVVGLNKV